MQLRHRGGSSNNTASNSGNTNQRGGGGGGNDDNHHDLNLTGLLQAGHGGGGVHDIINSLQPINTNYQNLIAHHFSMHPNDGQRGGGGWGTGGGHMHHDWAHDLMSVNTPINYDELFNQLSAPTPMITSGQLHRGTSHDVSGGRGIPSTVYVNQLTTAASNDSDDLLTYPSFTPDTNPSHKGSSNSAMQNNNNNNLTSDKKKISDAITYGPKFCEIFYRYCDEMKLHIDTKRHLMSLCIENLIPFICWARDTEERVRWMSNLLFDNDYLRPEVRNGIVIVLIYTFAAIKADHSHSGDMFTVLQDNDDGLGIANRFSLKIYNDPFGYLSCLKFSISSLIDAGAIPENERLNKPFKKGNSKPLPINQDEIQAFQVLKNRITQLLDTDQVNEAKSLVQVVSTHWQFRGNALRTKRFISAIEIMNQPANNVDIATAVYQEKMQLAREGKLVEEPVTTLADIKNMGTVKVNKASRKHGLNSEDGLGGEVNTSNITESNKRVKYDDEQSSLPPTGNSSSKVGFALGYSVRSTSNPNFPNSLERIGNSSEKPSNSDLYSSASEGSVGDTKQQQQQQQQQQHQHQKQQQHIAKLITNPSFLSSLPKPFSFKAIRFERIGINEWKMKETIIFDIQQFIHSLLQTQFLTSSSSSSSSTSPASSSSSSIFHNSIGSDFHVYLLNEKPLTPSMQDGYLRINYTASTPRIQNPNASTSSSMNSGMISGMVSLEHELRKLSTITTSWHLHELPQFQQFLLTYYQQYVLSQASASTANEEASTATSPKGRTINGGLSLHQFWNQFDHHYRQPASEATSPLSINTSSSSTVLGCIGYEVSSSMMIIIRENKFLGLQSDIWCRLYPNDFTHAMEELLYPLQQQQQQQQQLKGKEGEDTTTASSSSSSQLLSNSAKITFGEILMYFFPQLSILERRLMISAQQLSQKKGFTITFSLDDIFVKYAPINSSQTSTQQHQQQVTGDDVSIRSESEGNSNKQSSGSFLPPQSNSSAYQTIGVFTTPAKKILARLQSHTKIHDFILEIDTDFE